VSILSLSLSLSLSHTSSLSLTVNASLVTHAWSSRPCLSVCALPQPQYAALPTSFRHRLHVAAMLVLVAMMKRKVGPASSAQNACLLSVFSSLLLAFVCGELEMRQA
jgi:hypothetical protein